MPELTLEGLREGVVILRSAQRMRRRSSTKHGGHLRMAWQQSAKSCSRLFVAMTQRIDGLVPLRQTNGQVMS